MNNISDDNDVEQCTLISCKPGNQGSEQEHIPDLDGNHVGPSSPQGSRPVGSGGHGSFGQSETINNNADPSNPFGPGLGPGYPNTDGPCEFPRCLPGNHPEFDISSSIDDVTSFLGGSQPDIPIGTNFPEEDDDEDIFSVAVDTTASDISAISLPISSSIAGVPAVPQVSVVSSPASSTSSSSSSSPSTSISFSPTSWITFTTTKNTYTSFFSYRPCLTIFVPEMATKFLKNFNVVHKQITLCFTLPPFF